MNKTQEALKMAIEALESITLLCDDNRWYLIGNARKACKEALEQQEQDKLTFDDYEEVIKSHKALVRELDVLLNGEDNAALQASLGDIVAQIKHGKWKLVSLEQQEQEPVACMFCNDIDGECEEIGHIQQHYGGEIPADFTPLYTHPAKQLSDDEIETIIDEFSDESKGHMIAWGGARSADGEYVDMKEFARAIEAKIRGK